MNCKQCDYWSLDEKDSKTMKHKGNDVIFKKCTNELLGTKGISGAMLRCEKGPVMTMARFGCNFGKRGRKALAALLVLGLLFLPVLSHAAGSCAISAALFTDTYGTAYNESKTTKRVTYLCTHHTDNSLSAAIDMAPLHGWTLRFVSAAPGDTAPTTDTDLNLDTAAGFAILDQAGNGADMVDDADSRFDLPDNDWAVPLWSDDAITVSTANNAVASATFYLILTLSKDQ